jgi:hypothetical protein
MLALKCSLLNREYVLINVLKALVSIVFMCSLHAIFLSNITPRYFTFFTKSSSLTCSFQLSLLTKDSRYQAYCAVFSQLAVIYSSLF